MSRPPLPMPVIVGAPRSGTTLLRLMLDAHPDLAIPPETGFVVAASALDASTSDLRARFLDTVTAFPPQAPNWEDFGLAREALAEAVQALEPFTVADGLRAFYRLYAQRLGKPRWGEKTPDYSLHIDAIAALLPEARFVHLILAGPGARSPGARLDRPGAGRPRRGPGPHPLRRGLLRRPGGAAGARVAAPLRFPGSALVGPVAEPPGARPPKAGRTPDASLAGWHRHREPRAAPAPTAQNHGTTGHRAHRFLARRTERGRSPALRTRGGWPACWAGGGISAPPPN